MTYKKKLKQEKIIENKNVGTLGSGLKRLLREFIEHAYMQHSLKEKEEIFPYSDEVKILKLLNRLLTIQNFIGLHKEEYRVLQALLVRSNSYYLDKTSDILFYICLLDGKFKFLEEFNKSHLNIMLEHSLLEKVEFRVSKKILISVAKKVLVSNNYKNIIIRKLDKIYNLNIEELNDFEDKQIIILEIKNYKKKEIIEYYPDKEICNNVFLPDQDLKMYNLDEKLILEKKDIVCNYYIDLVDIYKIGNHIDFSKTYLRFLTINFLNGLEENKILWRNGKLLKNIYEYKNLFEFEKEYFDIDIVEISSVLKDLEKDMSKENYHKIINRASTGESLYEIFKFAQIIREQENDIDDNIAIIKRFKKLKYYDLKVALFCEEVLIKTPILIDDIIYFLKEMYKSNIYTSNSRKMLEYIKNTTKVSDEFIDEVLLDIKSKNGEFDQSFFVDLRKLYNCNKNNRKVYEIINRVIMNGKDIRYCHDMVYDFYKKFLDINALKKYLEVSKSLGLNIFNILTLKDCNFILDKYIDKSILKNIDEYIIIDLIDKKLVNTDAKFKAKAVKIIEKIIADNQKNKLVNQKNILAILSSESIAIYHEQIKIVLSKNVKELSENDMKIVETYINGLENPSERALKAMIDYYIMKGDINKYLTYINKYIFVEFESGNKDEDKLGENGKDKKFKELLIENSSNIEFLKVVIKNIDFDKIDKIDMLLSNIVLPNSDYDKGVFFDIIEYYENKKDLESARRLVIDKITNIKELDDYDYSSKIGYIMKTMNEDQKGKLYKKLIIRADIPMEFRCENQYLSKADLINNKIIIRGFENSRIVNCVAKSLMLEAYYNENEKIIDIFSKSDEDLINLSSDVAKEYNNRSKEIIYRKVKESFSDKSKADFLIELLVTCSYEFDKDYESLLDDRSSQDFGGKRNIIGDFMVYERIKNSAYDEIKIKNIFTSEVSDYKLIQFNIDCKDILIDYMSEDFNKDDIGEETYSLVLKPKDKKERNILTFIEKVKKLIRLQEVLINNDFIITDFRVESLKELNNSIMISLESIEVAKGKVKLMNNRFNYPSSILANKKYPIIDEHNTLILISTYMSKYIKENYKDDYKEFTKWSTPKKESETFGEYISELDNFIKEKTTLFHERSIKKKINMFKEGKLSIEDKKIVIEYIVKEELLDNNSKNIVISNCKFKDIDTLKYYLRCFNESTAGLNEEDFINLFEKIMVIIKSKEIDIENIIQNEKKFNSKLENFIISASKKTGFSNRDIFKLIKELKFLDIEILEKKLD